MWLVIFGAGLLGKGGEAGRRWERGRRWKTVESGEGQAYGECEDGGRREVKMRGECEDVGRREVKMRGECEDVGRREVKMRGECEDAGTLARTFIDWMVDSDRHRNPVKDAIIQPNKQFFF